jgi:3-dehydrosphinganine reductase
MRLGGTHAIITGGSRGIGLATARALQQRGARVSLVARDGEVLARASAELGGEAHGVRTAPADVADREALAAAFATLTAEAGPCDVLVTAAGISRPGYFQELENGIFRDLMDVNYFGTLHAVREVVPGMVERSRGSIVGVSSAAGLLGVFGFTAYSATKFAVRGLLEALRAEMVLCGVHVGCCYPPDVATEMLEREAAYKPAETEAISGTIRPLASEQVASAIVRGIERERFTITADVKTALLGRLAPLGEEIVRKVLDRIAARAQPPARVRRARTNRE